jgi:hypothetical protein
MFTRDDSPPSQECLHGIRDLLPCHIVGTQVEIAIRPRIGKAVALSV